ELLEFLDLSCNELSGGIPPSISNLPSLGMLNLSNNCLEGHIPTGNQLQTLADPSIYGNNQGLCGFPLSVCEPTSGERAEDHTKLGDLGLCYSVILGTVFGFWLWFGALFFLDVDAATLAAKYLGGGCLQCGPGRSSSGILSSPTTGELVLCRLAGVVSPTLLGSKGASEK
uniref:Leucine-rich repeat-containing N-terminal plant-type domain-containing protein n=1 Tax=Aegilops tauschii subsp. strangulata TaxID=200361 RepID=A0A453JAZ8_AEGTS